MAIQKKCIALLTGLTVLGGTLVQADDFDLTIALGEVEGNQNKSRVEPGSYHRIDTYLTNNGPDAAPGRILVTGEVLPECPYLVGWYLSEDATITTDDIQIGGFCPNGLQAGQTLRFWADVYVPVNITGGFYYWGAIVDYNQAVVETDESNNAALGDQVLVR
ncbi:hypothetical protein [Aliikangiella maris]|uniref:CARDB domain-containing protein n=2 Tax=Aliikangiella maris TaxID=3162458 RepID=A0ABV2BPS6_9GAMM